MSLSFYSRELTSTVSLTSSWDDLSLHDEPMVTDVKRPKSFNEPLHIFTSPMAYSSSPSPTRLAKVSGKKPKHTHELVRSHVMYCIDQNCSVLF